MKRKHSIIYSFLVASLLLSCNKEQPTENKEEVKTEAAHEEEASNIASLTEEQIKTVGITFGTIEMKDLGALIKANGNLRVPNDNKATVTSLYGGVIKSIRVQVGDYVKKGQVIATISNPEFIQLQEQYLTVNSRITYAEQEYRRQTELFNNDAGAKKNLQSASTELKTLRTQRASLQRQLQLMGISPGSVSNGNFRSGLVITAPISGTISSIAAQIGTYVDVSVPVAEILNNNAIHLDLQVFEKDLPKMKVGQEVTFRLTNNPENEYLAKVYSIGDSFENDSKTISVHCRVLGNKTGLIDGMNITGVVGMAKTTTPAVPDEAIAEADGKFYIFVKTNEKVDDHDENEATEKGKEDHHEKTLNFEKIEVAKGSSEMGFTAITPVKEIPANAEIVVKGAFFVNATLTNGGEHEH